MMKAIALDKIVGASKQSHFIITLNDQTRPGRSNLKLRHCLAAALLLTGLGQPVYAALPLNEDFNDNTATYTTILGGEATASAINIRLASNAINTDSEYWIRFLLWCQYKHQSLHGDWRYRRRFRRRAGWAAHWRTFRSPNSIWDC